MTMKRTISMALATCMALALAVPAGAATDPLEGSNKDALAEKVLAAPVTTTGVDQETASATYTIEFPSAEDIQAVQNEAVISDEARNAMNTKAAKDYVTGLNLSESGWECIETACLEQIDALAAETDGVLTSYTVYVPESDNSMIPASAPARAKTAIAKFGTYSGVQFYSNIYSEYTKEYQKNTYNNRTKIKQWGSGAIDLVLCFAQPIVTVPITFIKTMIGAPSSYTIRDGAYFDYYFNLSAKCRGIYTKNSNGTYRMLTSSETGKVSPAIVFHPVDGNYGTVYSRNLETKPVKTSNYDNSSWQMQVAYHQYQNNAYGNDPYKMALSTIAQSVAWK
ncbi:hypothetical protein [Evtepia sp.]|uniref:hypothetical protein n=1 Tax=Evtepia sp. TaxID=2773933 RepID=UPI002E75B158|nr:hypothetical protein [Evtepia sp.]MEE0256999.1 hypothetical protein [Evtepia sp.]